MKEIPILFSTEMVQAILDGRKSQTRRTLKVKGCKLFTPENPNDWTKEDIERWNENYHPCGQPGDLLWVREAFKYIDEEETRVDYKSQYTYPEYHMWRPSIHMPKSAARIWLQVEEVKVERLQYISWDDALSEGIHVKYWGDDKNQPYAYRKSDPQKETTDYQRSPIVAFRDLWTDINGRTSWNANPWVWVVKFKVLSTAGKPQLETLNLKLETK